MKTEDLTTRRLTLGVNESEQATGVSKWTWRKWAYEGKIDSVKCGRRLLIPVSEIERILAEGLRPRRLAR